MRDCFARLTAATRTQPVLSGLDLEPAAHQRRAGWRREPSVASVPSWSRPIGATWAPIPNVGAGYSGAGRTTLAVGSPGDQVVYAFAATAGNGAQKDFSDRSNGGLNWTPLGLPTKKPLNPNPDQPDMDIMAGQAFYNQMVLVDPGDESRNTVYIGGQLSSAKSTDGGATWRIVTNWLAQFRLPYVHADFHAAAFATLQGEPAHCVRHRRWTVHQHRRSPDVQQPKERRHLVVLDLRDDRQPETRQTT